MLRVATNQNQAEAERAHYLYTQHAVVVSRKGSKVLCQEITDARTTPSASGSHVELLKLDGRMWVHHKYETYTTLPAGHEGKSKVENDPNSLTIEIGGDDTDRDLVESMRSNLTNDNSRTASANNLYFDDICIPLS